MMTHNLEKILFDLNEGLHKAGLMPDDKYVTQEIVFFSLTVTALLSPFIVRGIDFILTKDRDDKYFIVILSLVLISLIYIINGYFLTLLTIVMVGLVIIVNKYPRYRAIREFLSKFF